MNVISNTLSPIVGLAYFIYYTYRHGATFGKKTFNLRVEPFTGGVLTLKRVILRELVGRFGPSFLIIIFLLIYISLYREHFNPILVGLGIFLGAYAGYFLILFNRRKRALHDYLAGTLVTRDANKKISKWLYALVALPLLLVVVGIFAAMLMTSLDSARNKAQDATTKTLLSSLMSSIVIYQDDHESYKGFKIDYSSYSFAAASCSGNPVVNISPDGMRMAVFLKSCKKNNLDKYYCLDARDGSITMDIIEEKYVREGLSTCNPQDNDEVGKMLDDSLVSRKQATKHFSDDFVNYELDYPATWQYQNKKDADRGIIANLFSPVESTGEGVSIVSFLSPVSLSDIELEAMTQELVRQEGADLSTQDIKKIVYTFKEGEAVTGREVVFLTTLSGVRMKKWLVVVPNGRKTYSFQFVSRVETFDQNLPQAQAIFTSWKVFK